MNHLRDTISKDEAISQIEQVYHAGYDPDSPGFDAFEQLLVCESLAETEAVAKEQCYNPTTQEEQPYPSENAYVNGDGDGTYKRRANFELNDSKRQVIQELGLCIYKTPIFKIAGLLEELFQECESKPYYWPRIAQYYNPRTINRVLYTMTRTHGEDWKTIQNPAAYFTNIIRYRKKRKIHQQKKKDSST